MNIMQIFQEISDNRNDNYYIELAQNEVLLIPALIEITSDGSYSERMKGYKLINKISQKYPEKIIPFTGYIIRIFDKHSDLPSWCIWKVLSNIAHVINDEEYLLIDRFIKALDSDNISEFSIACDCAARFAEVFPESRKRIEASLKTVESREFILSGEASESCHNIALEKVKSFYDSIN